MSKAQQMSDDLRKRHDYDLLECEALPLFDAIDALTQSHDRLLQVAIETFNTTGDLLLRTKAADAIEKARIV